MKHFCKTKSGMRISESRHGNHSHNRYMFFKFEAELCTFGYSRRVRGIKQHINEVSIIEVDSSIIHAPLQTKEL
jgi:hypothetical protein